MVLLQDQNSAHFPYFELIIYRKIKTCKILQGIVGFCTSSISFSLAVEQLSKMKAFYQQEKGCR